MLSPLLSPTEGSSQVGLNNKSGAASGHHYSSTSKLNIEPPASPKLNLQRSRKISRSSEDLASNNPVDTLKTAATNFLGVMVIDPRSGELMVRGGSLQKDLDIATQVLEEGAVETAAIIEKGVLNPFSKLTKGIGAVLKGGQPQPHEVNEAETEAAPESENVPPRLASSSQTNQVANSLLKAKIVEAKSQTKVLLI